MVFIKPNDYPVFRRNRTTKISIELPKEIKDFYLVLDKNLLDEIPDKSHFLFLKIKNSILTHHFQLRLKYNNYLKYFEVENGKVFVDVILKSGIIKDFSILSAKLFYKANNHILKIGSSKQKVLTRSEKARICTIEIKIAYTKKKDKINNKLIKVIDEDIENQNKKKEEQLFIPYNFEEVTTQFDLFGTIEDSLNYDLFQEIHEFLTI
jgi:hypothetical protein